MASCNNKSFMLHIAVSKVTQGNFLALPLALLIQCQKPEATCTECQVIGKMRSGGAFLTMKLKAVALFATCLNPLAMRTSSEGLPRFMVPYGALSAAYSEKAGVNKCLLLPLKK